MVSLRAQFEPAARAAAERAGIDADRFVAQIGQESGWADDVIYCRRVSSAGARGIAQIVERFHPTVNPCDPLASLDYAAKLMAGHLTRNNGDWAVALSCYNAGPGATASGLSGHLAGWPYDETVTYVAVILGIGRDEARRRLLGQPPSTEAPMQLSTVLARARARAGDPYVWGGKAPGGFDCSGLVAYAYGGQVPSFTDALFDATYRVETPAPGDIVLYEYSDSQQPNVRFPHVELFLSDTRCYGARFGVGVGEHDQLPRAQARRYYRRVPGVVDDTSPATPSPPPSAPSTPVADPLAARIAELSTRLGYASQDIAAALEKEVASLEASLGALKAAIATLRGQRP